MEFNIPASATFGYRFLVAGGTVIPFQINSSYNATFAGTTTPTLPSPTPSLNGGDLIVQRSGAAGGIAFGGSTHVGMADYNVSNGTSFSFHSDAGYAPIFGGAYTNASDARWKKDVDDLSPGLETIMALKPKSFTWIASGRKDLGFIAQDVLPILPELVTEDFDGYLGLNYLGMIPVIVRAIQQLARQ